MPGMRGSRTVMGRRRFDPVMRPAAVIAVLLGLALALPAAAGPGVSLPPQCTAGKVPLLVVGGTPAGVAAAVAAARMGTPVILTEARPYLGGDLTGAMLNMFDMDFGAKGEHLARGVFLEIYKRLGMTFDVELAKRAFKDEVKQEPLITLRLRTRPIAALVADTWLQGVVFENTLTRETETVCAQRVIDATDDADIAAMAGVPYSIGREGSGIDRAMMSATLMFELSGVNWNQVVTYVNTGREHHMARGGAYKGNVWGYGQLMRLYRPTQPGVAIYDLNLGLQNDHSVLINGLLVFGVDGTDPGSIADGLRRARTELPALVMFLRETAPGFAKAALERSADYLYIRETRHIRGLYTLTTQDIVDSRVFWDAVGVASYPIDLHPYKPGEMNPYAPRRYTYTIPFRSLVPLAVSNLLVASRAISASYEAAGSARVCPTTMEEGQAAGVAAIVSLAHRVSFWQLAARPEYVHDVQGLLVSQGAYLLPETVASFGRPVTPWPAPPTGVPASERPASDRTTPRP